MTFVRCFNHFYLCSLKVNIVLLHLSASACAVAGIIEHTYTWELSFVQSWNVDGDRKAPFFFFLHFWLLRISLLSCLFPHVTSQRGMRRPVFLMWCFANVKPQYGLQPSAFLILWSQTHLFSLLVSDGHQWYHQREDWMRWREAVFHPLFPVCPVSCFFFSTPPLSDLFLAIENLKIYYP